MIHTPGYYLAAKTVDPSDHHFGQGGLADTGRSEKGMKTRCGNAAGKVLKHFVDGTGILIGYVLEF
jgi:hypothetical protein